MNTTSKNFTASDMQKLFDPAMRQSIQSDPRQYATEIGLVSAGDTTTKVKVVTCSSDTMYMPFVRISAQAALDADDLASIQAAGVLGSVGSAGTAGTMGTVCTTASTVSSIGSVGTAGSA